MNALIERLLPAGFIRFYRSFQKRRRHWKQLRQYRGDDVLCPVCMSHFSKFGPFGVRRRENALCHICGSLERHRLIWLYLTRKTDIFNSDRPVKLLHFAPERKFYALFSNQKNIEYVPCDIDPEKYKYKGAIPVRKIDATNIPFDESLFDVILCSHVLEHISDDRQAMQELYRVMKPGGLGVFQVPVSGNAITYEDFSIQDPAEREKKFGQHDHVRVYGHDYPDHLRKAGFRVIEDDFVKSFSKEEQQRYGLNPEEIIYRCEK